MRVFWQDESYDHWVRNGPELEKKARSIEWNPVRAVLAVVQCAPGRRNRLPHPAPPLLS